MEAVQDAVAVNLSPAEAAALEAASMPYVGRWNRLVSTTNWEKGRIIYEWRAALMDSGAPAREFSDEAWAQRVGGVSGQHAGRLRRVYQRFGEVCASYEGLYWSHFQTALEWDDAEMWLEGALQNGWSVNQMRLKRWETLGTVAEQSPEAAESAATDAEEDEDFDVRDAAPLAEAVPMSVAEAKAADASDVEADEEEMEEEASASAAEPAPQPFAKLPELPEDLAEAVESFKLAIVRHRLDGWRQVRREHVLDALDALRTLALASA